MQTSKRVPRVALKPALAALAMALPFYAQADLGPTASASLTGLTYRLIDLNPADGIAPTVTFNNVVSVDVTHYNNSTGYQSAYDVSSVYFSLLPDSGVNTLLTTESASASASQGYKVSALASSDEALSLIDPTQRTYQSYGVNSSGNASTFPGTYDEITGYPISVTLGANTGLIITGVANITGQFDKDAFLAQVGAMPNLRDSYLYDYDQVGASVSMSLSTESSEVDANGNTILTTTNLSSSQLTSSSWDTNFDHTKTLSIQFSNLTDADTNVLLSLQANAHAKLEGSLDFRDLTIEPPPPITPPSIPEPSTYVLMGLGLVGISLARRRARA